MIIRPLCYSSLFAILLLNSALSSQVFGQSPAAKSSASDVKITVGGEVDQPRKLTERDLAKLPRRTVQAQEHDGRLVTFEGLALYDVLQLAGVSFGELLRGRTLAKYLLVQCKGKR